ncbi:hypothetical protein R1flu_012156 [Riccia fluitans]|uniref:Uncharacterized protein n=1 Tax=Riccia fluitans TaxID=41844 RepID=A0ABD1ZC95_9MARC
MGFEREYDKNDFVENDNSAKETTSDSRQSRTVEGDDHENECPSWRVLENPVYTTKIKLRKIDGAPRELRITTNSLYTNRSNGLYRSRSEVGISRKKRKNWKSLQSGSSEKGGASSDGSKRLERSRSAPALRDAASSGESTSRVLRKITLSRFRSRLKESEAFRRSGVALLWEYFASTMMAFGRSLFSNTSNLTDSVDTR